MIARYGENDYGYSEAGYGYGVSAFTGFDGLSIIPDTLGWWSVSRRVLSRYTGPAIRLRRSSDSAELDFYGIGPQGEVSTSDVRAWNGWNLLRHTNSFDNAYWVKSRASISPSSFAAPDGTMTAFKLSEEVETGTHRIYPVPDITKPTAALTYTFTCHFKAGERTFAQLRAAENAETNPSGVVINLATGSIVGTYGSFTSQSAVITDVGDGWYRVSYTFTTLTAGALNVYILPALNGNLSAPAYVGDPASGIHIWRAQVERASSFTTYEPRTTTSAGDSFLVTLYDQSGLARHFTQSTTTLQPIVCEQGVPVTENGRLAAKFVAADGRRMSVPSSTAMFNALHTTGGTVLAVSRANDTAVRKAILSSREFSTLGYGISLERGTTEIIELQTRSNGVLDVSLVTTSGASTSQSVLVTTIDPDNATAADRALVWQNGTALTGTNAAATTPTVANASNNLTLGGRGGEANAPYDGPISEIALFSSLISTADRTAWQSRSGTFYGVTIS